jgi:hypothetical protein
MGVLKDLKAIAFTACNFLAFSNASDLVCDRVVAFSPDFSCNNFCLPTDHDRNRVGRMRLVVTEFRCQIFTILQISESYSKFITGGTYVV